jgi:high-affinity Fe2+/Pb2+ permease
MFVQYMAKTNMMGFWQYIFDYCNESYPCVLGWMMVGILGFVVVLVGVFFIMRRLSRRE